MKTNTEVLQALAESPVYREYEQAFAEAVGLPLALVTAENPGWSTATKPGMNGFCAMMANTPGARAACGECTGRLCQRAVDSPALVVCPYGLTEAAVPVRVGTQVVGYLRTGQVAGRTPSPAQCRLAVTGAKAAGVSEPEARIRAAYQSTPVVPKKRVESAARILFTFSTHLSLLANQFVLQQSQLEPPVITKARQFISEHLQEPLHLAQVAKAVHTSTFYFCKLFRKFTGMTFTEFVSRMRVERAKELLLNPNRRVTEVAFEVGFQSLTHFNRRFRRFVGEPPTEWRQHATAQ